MLGQELLRHFGQGSRSLFRGPLGCRIGTVRDGLIVATGHGSEGVILGYGTAELVRDLVSGNTPSIDPSPFDPLRF